MKRSRRAIVDELRARRRDVRATRRRRVGALLLAVLLALLALLGDCSCTEAPPPPPPAPAASDPLRSALVGSEPAPSSGRIERHGRPTYTSEPPDPLPWVASFRMQVAARGPRLARCFVGAERPGALKWTAAVDPTSGRASDHLLEPTLASDPLDEAQRACVLDVLTDPPYRLDGGHAPSTPSRVGIVIEF